MSRTGLADTLHLTTATLTSICNDFLQRGILIQLNKAGPQTSGRKRYPLAINSTYKYVVSISLHYTGHTLAVTNLLGEPVSVRRVEAVECGDPAAFFHQIAELCIRMLWECQIPPASVLGAGVCIIGPVDHVHGVALHPFKIFDRLNVPVQHLLERELPFPVCVESNVCSFLTAEMLMGNATGNTLLAVRWGPGVGCASSVDGAICKNSGFQSAEIGHTLFYRDSERVCKCGRTGCLETGVSMARIEEEMRRFAETEPALREALRQNGNPTIHNILSFLTLDSQPLRNFMDCCTQDLAVAVNNAVQILQPDQVILSGVLFDSDVIWDRFLHHIRTIDPTLSAEMFLHGSPGDRLEYIGPAAIAVKSFLLDTGGEIAS